MKPYTSLPGLEHIYLEDSYVLGWSLGEDAVTLDMEFVLTERHRLYAPPKPGEQYCYRRDVLRFSGFWSADLTESGLPGATDASGETDYGNIDSFVVDGVIQRLEGDWGSLEVEGGTVALVFE